MGALELLRRKTKRLKTHHPVRKGVQKDSTAKYWRPKIYRNVRICFYFKSNNLVK
jgi:hypothetical protein